MARRHLPLEIIVSSQEIGVQVAVVARVAAVATEAAMVDHTVDRTEVRHLVRTGGATSCRPLEYVEC